jgi:hypothetical protein
LVLLEAPEKSPVAAARLLRFEREYLKTDEVFSHLLREQFPTPACLKDALSMSLLRRVLSASNDFIWRYLTN